MTAAEVPEGHRHGCDTQRAISTILGRHFLQRSTFHSLLSSLLLQIRIQNYKHITLFGRQGIRRNAFFSKPHDPILVNYLLNFHVSCSHLHSEGFEVGIEVRLKYGLQAYQEGPAGSSGHRAAHTDTTLLPWLMSVGLVCLWSLESG